MAILTGPEIRRLVERGRAGDLRAGAGSRSLPLIEVDPWEPAHCGPNSLDVRLADTLTTYQGEVLDPHRDNRTATFTIPKTGYILEPGRLYLGCTVERVRCEGLVPYIDGRSSVGRLGLSVHVTAGRADDGWDGVLTLELWCVQPVRVYAGMRLAQVTFHTIEGERSPYRGRYQGSAGVVASRFHEGEGGAG